MEGEGEVKQQSGAIAHEAKKPFGERFSLWYDKSYKLLLIIPALILILSLVYMVSFTVQNNDIFRKDVTLTGGTSLTIYSDTLSSSDLETSLNSKFLDISVRRLTDFSTGKQLAVTVESGAEPDELKSAVEQILGYSLDDKNSSIEFTGESLSKSFYKELILAMVLAFLFMSVVIFFIFKVPLPSAYVVLCAFMDIIVPMSVVNILGMRLSTAGIAAFLMLVGYSVDTDIVLTTRVLKRREEKLNSRIHSAFKTGVTMTLTSLAAVTIGYIVTISPILKQIFFILIIGLLTDIVVTWLMNASLIKWYCEKKEFK